ncbi:MULTISPECIES: DUF6512 family protein [unclassified Jeotgalibaca]|uniref:DUF6512 family protein n=1 Tax=unclassified Jeotgalibaca TaxID=2621505 RepID=UPI003FD22154
MIPNRSTVDNHFNKKYSWIGTIVVYLFSTPLHFLYKWTGEITLVGIFTPINESVWEHLKLVFWPLLIWWGMGYLLFRDKKQLSPSKWFTAGTVSIFISMLFIVGWYYIWKGGFAKESLVIDFSSLIIGVPIGQAIAIHIYRVIQPRKLYLLLSFVFLFVMGVLFVYTTLSPPAFPIFTPNN